VIATRVAIGGALMSPVTESKKARDHRRDHRHHHIEAQTATLMA
jgi:hypothetical protein